MTRFGAALCLVLAVLGPGTHAKFTSTTAGGGLFQDLSKPVTLSWTTDAKPVSIELQRQETGKENLFKAYTTIATNVNDEKYEWTPKDLPTGKYLIAFTDAKGDKDVSLSFTVGTPADITNIVSIPTNAPSSTPTPDASGTVPSTPSSTAPPGQPPTGSSGLSKGAKAGIGVGASMGSLALLSAVIFLLRRHRRRQTTSKPDASPEESGEVASNRSPTPPSRAILKGFPRALSPTFAKPKSLPKLRTASPLAKKETAEKKKEKPDGDIAELPAGNMDLEVPDRHELPTPANTPELGGTPSLPRWL